MIEFVFVFFFVKPMPKHVYIIFVLLKCNNIKDAAHFKDKQKKHIQIRRDNNVSSFFTTKLCNKYYDLFAK